MRVTHVGFLATQKGAADLDGTGAEHERRRRGAAVCHPAGGDDWNPHRIDNLGKSEKSPGCILMSMPVNVPRWPPASVPCAMIASTPRCSSSRASATVGALERMKIPADLRARMTSGAVETAAALLAKPGDAALGLVGAPVPHAEPAETARVGHCDGQPRRAGAAHRRLQDRPFEVQSLS
jgi:hypothetical protein